MAIDYGNTDFNTNSAGLSQNWGYAIVLTAPASGLVQSISLKVGESDSVFHNDWGKGVLWNNSNGAVIAVGSREDAVTGSNSILTSTFSSPPTVVQGITYKVGFVGIWDTVTIGYYMADDPVVTPWYRDTANSAASPQTFDVVSSGDAAPLGWGIYYTYVTTKVDDLDNMNTVDGANMKKINGVWLYNVDKINTID